MRTILATLLLSLTFDHGSRGDVILTPSANAQIHEPTGSVVTPGHFTYTRGAMNPSLVRYAALEFDISFLSTNHTINSAILNLKPLSFERQSSGINTMEIFIHGYDGDNMISGDERFITNQIAGPFEVSWRFGITHADSMSSIDVTPFLQSLVDSGVESSGFILKPESFTGFGYLGMGYSSSSNIFSSSRPPFLTISTSIPEPQTLVYLIASLAMLSNVLIIRRSRKPGSVKTH